MQIFFIDLATTNLTSQAFEYYVSLLSVEEKTRMERISSVETRNNFICGRVLIKTTLAKMLGCEAQNVILKATPNGRLEIESPLSQLHFNISHSRSYVVLGVHNNPIGIDIEYVKNRNFLDIAKYYFTKKEFEILESINSDAERQKIFHYYWTIKESFIKCNGEQLFNKTRDLECIMDVVGKTIKHNFEHEYQLFTMCFDQNYIASIAIKSDLEKIDNRDFIEVQQVTNLQLGTFITKKIDLLFIGP